MVETGGIQFIGATRERIGCLRRLSGIQKVSCGVARLSRSRDIGNWRGRRSCSRPAIRVCLWRVMCGRRVGSAVGEGAMSVQFVHEYLRGM
jgi:hypothetical protein